MPQSKSRELWNLINRNKELKHQELLGFRKGVRRRKTLNVPTGEIFNSLEKQWEQLQCSYLLCEDDEIVVRKIADLRNVAGCLFLKLKGG